MLLFVSWRNIPFTLKTGPWWGSSTKITISEIVKKPQQNPVNERNRLIYKRGCQEHFSPSAGCAGLFRDIQPSHHGRRSSGVLHLGCSIALAASSLVATTPISFETHQAVRLYGGNHGSI